MHDTLKKSPSKPLDGMFLCLFPNKSNGLQLEGNIAIVQKSQATKKSQRTSDWMFALCSQPICVIASVVVVMTVQQH